MALANAQLHLQTAFRNFYQRKDSGFPNFKKKKSRQSYTTNLVNCNISLERGYLTLPKLGKVRIRQHREIPEGYRLKGGFLEKDKKILFKGCYEGVDM